VELKKVQSHNKKIIKRKIDFRLNFLPFILSYRCGNYIFSLIHSIVSLYIHNTLQLLDNVMILLLLLLYEKNLEQIMELFKFKYPYLSTGYVLEIITCIVSFFFVFFFFFVQSLITSVLYIVWYILYTHRYDCSHCLLSVE
jgi:hypothetical protein